MRSMWNENELTSTKWSKWIWNAQVYKRALRRGFELVLMVVGTSGLGKSTLVSIFLAAANTFRANLLVLMYSRLDSGLIQNFSIMDDDSFKSVSKSAWRCQVANLSIFAASQVDDCANWNYAHGNVKLCTCRRTLCGRTMSIWSQAKHRKESIHNNCNVKFLEEFDTK